MGHLFSSEETDIETNENIESLPPAVHVISLKPFVVEFNDRLTKDLSIGAKIIDDFNTFDSFEVCALSVIRYDQKQWCLVCLYMRYIIIVSSK